MTRQQLIGWSTYAACVAFCFTLIEWHAHDPATIAQAKAQHAKDERAVDQTLAQVGCAGDLEDHDDGKTPAETVAKAIIAKCGPFMPAPAGPPCSTDPKCLQALQQINLQTETEGVLEERYDRAKAQADQAQTQVREAADAWAKGTE